MSLIECRDGIVVVYMCDNGLLLKKVFVFELVDGGVMWSIVYDYE